MSSSSASLLDWWGWIAEQEVQRTLSFLGSGLIALAGAAWIAYVHFSKKPEKAATAVSVTASSGGIAAVGNVTHSAGNG